MTRKIISSDKAPAAIGTYSQAVRIDNTVYLSGQIPLVPETMSIVSTDISRQIQQVFNNLAAVAGAAGGSLDDIAKLNVYLTDLDNFAVVNKIMAEYFQEPYPARAVIGVLALPKQALIEIDAILHLQH